LKSIPDLYFAAGADPAGSKIEKGEVCSTGFPCFLVMSDE